jgi:hypothetical protein
VFIVESKEKQRKGAKVPQYTCQLIDGKIVEIERIKGPEKRVSFGDVRQFFQIPKMKELKGARLKLIYTATDLRGVIPSTVRVFKQDEKTKEFLLVEKSGLNRNESYIWAEINEAGIYGVFGLPSDVARLTTIRIRNELDPWIAALEKAELDTTGIWKGICHLIMCAPEIRTFMANPEGLDIPGLGGPGIDPGIPQPIGGGSICDECMSFSPGGGSGGPDGVLIGDSPLCLDLNTWLADNPQIEAAMIWQRPDFGEISYPSWTDSMKNDLADFVEKLCRGDPLGLDDPPDNQAVLADDDYASQILNEDDAWKLYCSYIAQSIVTEMKNLVSWSITGYSYALLRVLFNSKEFFLYNSAVGGYSMQSSSGRALPAPPDYTYDFIIENDIVRTDRVETIGAMIEWCGNLSHFLYGPTAKNMEDHWQYRGFPPVSRIIEGTIRDGETSPRHWTAGCHGTTGFLRSTLRVLNIPVMNSWVCGHSLPFFATDNYYLSHGDDPYSQLVETEPPYAGIELLIDQAQFDAWFGDGVPPESRCANIGRQVRELAIDHLSNLVLRAYCYDLENGLDQASGTVYRYFDDFYSIEELQARTLWARLEARVNELGGCDSIP